MLHIPAGNTVKQGKGDPMKSAAEVFGFHHSEHAPLDKQAHNHPMRSRYILVTILLAVVYLLSTLIAAGGEGFSINIGLGFIVFWLAGGAITLTLLTLAAKK